MNTRQLLNAFAGWREQGRELVLATVYQTSGSTYSKAGAQMLINDAGQFQGMLSGGCLEGDLAERAAAVLSSGLPQAVTFDLGIGDDGLWGLGVGCDGVMRVFLQPLRSATGYEPFASVAKVYAGTTVGGLATVIRSEHGSLPAGAAHALIDGTEITSDLPDPLRERVSQLLQDAIATRTTSLRQERWRDKRFDLLCAVLVPPPQVLVLGAGLDAEPLVRLCSELGWRVTVQDHRQAYIAKGNFENATAVCNFPAAELARQLDLSLFDAAIVMSHHLETDRCYLEVLADTGMRYIGLLGPVSRRTRLLRELGGRGAALESRLHGPAGFDIGGRGPAAIALSIAAEMHKQFASR